jgi:hypothetical protein
MAELTTLYRPVGPRELELIRQSDFCRFPPRLPEQPFFYPVLNEEYAIQIARDWNARDAGSGYVLKFEIRSDFLSAYDVHVVGSAIHREYWIPATELDAFNANIVGAIQVTREFRKTD